MTAFLISNKDLREFEINLELIPSDQKTSYLVEYAWYLRYSDMNKSLLLCEEALQHLTSESHQSELTQVTQALQGRIYLTQAEIALETLEFEQCEFLLKQFQSLNQVSLDAPLYIDFYRIKSAFCLSNNKGIDIILPLLNGRTIALKNKDLTSVYLLEILLARIITQSIIPDVQQLIEEKVKESAQALFIDESKELPKLNDFPSDTPSYIYSLFKEFLATKKDAIGKTGLSCQLLIEAFEMMEEYGYPQKSILIISNICYSLGIHNDFDTALDWVDRGIKLSKSMPNCIAVAMFHTQAAELFRKTKNYQAAQNCLNESLSVHDKYHFIRNHAIALRILADLQYDQENYELSLNSYIKFSEHCQNKLPQEFALLGRKGKAKNYAQLHIFDAAIENIEAAISISQEHNYPYYEVSSCIDAAKILKSAQRSQIKLEKAPLDFLEQAYSCAKTLNGYLITSELLNLLSNEYAELEQFERAFTFSQLAIQSKDREYDQATMHHTITTQMRMKTDRALKDAEHHKLIAEIEAQRTLSLERQRDILNRLSEIGQEICAQLNPDGLFNLVNNHVHALLHADHFSILMLNANHTTLHMHYGRELGKVIEHKEIILKKEQNEYTLCTQTLKEILIEDTPQEIFNQNKQSIVLHSQLLVPLMIANKLLGVMVIKSREQHIYQEVEQQIFRTLCAYTAIALDNANAYSQLKNAQTQLLEKEKFAALGSLVAGIAHELNTPIGNSVLIASTIKESCEQLSEYIKQGKIQRSELLQFIQRVNEGSRLIGNGLEIAANLVNSFKQVAVDSSAEHQRLFSLNSLITDVAAMMRNQIRLGQHHIHIDLDEEIHMFSYPGGLAQILSNLISNSLLHGFENMNNRQISIKATHSKSVEDMIIIEYRDNGKGISPENLKRIFDPFFTTKLGQGGSGLGLSICYNLATALLQGKIEVNSDVGVGTQFTLSLPVRIVEANQETLTLAEPE
jgi:signal transduction histidine kinase